MSESKAAIFGCAGPVLTAEEAAFFAEHRPWGFILFGRNIESLHQVADLTASLRESIGRPDAPVLIDQEGGRVQRFKPPLVPQYPSRCGSGRALLGQSRGGPARHLDHVAASCLRSSSARDHGRLPAGAGCAGARRPRGDRQPGLWDHAGPGCRVGSGCVRGAQGGRAAAGDQAHSRSRPRRRRYPLRIAARRGGPRTELSARDFAPFRALSGEAMAMSAHVVYTDIDPDHPATTSRPV